MHNADTTSFNWEYKAYEKFGYTLQNLKHDYHNMDLFSDASLIKLLNTYPREWLQCFTMGYNPEDYTEWKAVHIADSTGKEILEAVKKGGFWINIINIDKGNKKIADIIDGIY